MGKKMSYEYAFGIFECIFVIFIYISVGFLLYETIKFVLKSENDSNVLMINVANGIAKDQIKVYKKEISHLKNLQQDTPNRVQNLNLLFDNVLCTKGLIAAFLHEKNIVDINSLETSCDVLSIDELAFLKSKIQELIIIRELSYEFVYDILTYFCTKYLGSDKNAKYKLYLNKFHKKYKEYIPIEYILNFRLRRKRYTCFKSMIVNFISLTALLRDKIEETCEQANLLKERFFNITETHNILNLQLYKMNYEFELIENKETLTKFDGLINDVNDEFDRAMQFVLTEIDFIDNDS